MTIQTDPSTLFMLGMLIILAIGAIRVFFGMLKAMTTFRR